nr:MAG TPA: hypothetical protein [Caudoviricetes sp.]
MGKYLGISFTCFPRDSAFFTIRKFMGYSE